MATLAAHYLQILVPTVLVLALAGVLTGVLYAHERFTMPAVVSIVWNLVIIAFMAVWHEEWGVYALAWGTLVGTVVELILLGFAMRAAGEPLTLNFHFGDPYLRRVLALMVPITITLGILNFNALIDTYFAQYVSDHAAAEIGYSFRLYQLPQGIFAVTIGTILFPSLSRFAAQKDMDALPRHALDRACGRWSSSRCRSSPGSRCWPRPIVRLVYQRGTFTATATHEVSLALAAFTLGLTFANVNIMFNRSFQSMQKPWLPLYVGLVNLGLNAVLDWVLLGPLGVAGITLSTSIVSIFNLIVLVWLLRRLIGRIDGRRIGRSAAGADPAALAPHRRLRRPLVRLARLCRGRVPAAVGLGRGRGRRRRTRLSRARQAAQARRTLHRAASRAPPRRRFRRRAEHRRTDAPPRSRPRGGAPSRSISLGCSAGHRDATHHEQRRARAQAAETIQNQELQACATEDAT